MSKTPSLEELQKKIFYSTLSDGLSEMFQGFLLGLTTLLFINFYTEIIFALLIIICQFLWRGLRTRIKTTYIYPRIGIVEFHPNHQHKLKKYRRGFGIIMLISIIFYFIMIFTFKFSINTTLQFLPILLGGIIFARAMFFWLFTGRKYYLGIGFSCFILGIVIPLLPVASGQINAQIFSSISALTYLLLGMIKLRRFLHNHPLNGEPEQKRSLKNEEKE